MKSKRSIKRQKTRRLLQRRINKIKSVPCMDCGEAYPPYCMDFDHRVKGDKHMAVSRMVSICKPWPVIQAEIAKCDVVCAICHRIRTHKK